MRPRRRRGYIPDLLIGSSLVLVACSEPTEADRQHAGEPAATAQAEALPPDEAGDDGPAAEAVSFARDNDLLSFEYSYPAAAAEIAPLREFLDSERRDRLAKSTDEARSFKAEAARGGFAFNPYSFEKHWAVVTNLDRFLSLSAQFYEFSGGAHGMSGFDSLIWDREANRRIDPMAMFRSPGALESAVSEPFCTQLDIARERKRGTPVERSDDGFNDCIKATEQTLILGSSNGRTFDRIGFLIGPYAAGPYAEGDYEVTLPVTPAVREAVDPQYREFFSVAGG